MLGISTYNPNFHSSANSFIKEHSKTLSELLGKKIDRYWIMWNTKENEWLADAPVILEIEGNRYEFTVYQISEFSMTINSFELTDKLDWYGSGNEMPLIWKKNGKYEMTKNLNKTIVGINILTYTMESDLLTGLEFVLKKESNSDNKNFFSIYNGLDENAMDKIEIQFENQIKRIKITDHNTIYSS